MLEQKEQSYALIMKGGGVKGLAYVGALKELEKYYNFDWFIGTSAGAIVAVLLAAGYTTNELETILREKNFRDFLDASVKLPTNLIFKGGLFEARSFNTWMDQLIAAKVRSFEPLPLRKLPKRATVYASRRYRRALIFDSERQNSETAASFAVRCSMSIPFVFTPQREQGLRVLDGGMQNNYPVSSLLAAYPDTKFIGLYLGNYYEGMPKEPSLLKDMVSIWTEAVDVEALEQYEPDTVVIDPRPIKTIDFNLTAVEKDFLLKIGKAAALRFLLSPHLQGGPTAEDVREAEEQAQAAKAEVEGLGSRRRRRRRMALTIFCIALGATSGGGWYVFRSPQATAPSKNINTNASPHLGEADSSSSVASSPASEPSPQATLPQPTAPPRQASDTSQRNKSGSPANGRAGRKRRSGAAPTPSRDPALDILEGKKPQ